MHGVVVTTVNPTAFAQGVGMLRHGGTMSFVGLLPCDFPLPIFEVVLTGLTIRGSIIGTRMDLDEALHFAAEGKVRPTVATDSQVRGAGRRPGDRAQVTEGSTIGADRPYRPQSAQEHADLAAMKPSEGIAAEPRIAMRLLLATDGSACASTAADLVAGTRWPDDMIVEVLRVIDPIPSTWAYAPVPDLQATHEQLRAEALDAVNETAAQLRSHGLRATGTVLLGPEAPTIVHRATTTATDMIVCGSRGRGHLRSVLLGSVSAEVAATAGCSVLVARHPTVSSVVLAVDGSESATAAEHLVTNLPMFTDATLDLVTATGPSSGPDDEWQAHVRLLSRLQHAVGLRLRGHSREPHELLLSGPPAREIVDHAQRSHADLIVLGAHAQTAMDRLLLGSTTLEVLTHSPASVLVAREPVSWPRSGASAWTVPWQPETAGGVVTLQPSRG